MDTEQHCILIYVRLGLHDQFHDTAVEANPQGFAIYTPPVQRHQLELEPPGSSDLQDKVRGDGAQAVARELRSAQRMSLLLVDVKTCGFSVAFPAGASTARVVIASTPY